MYREVPGKPEFLCSVHSRITCIRFPFFAIVLLFSGRQRYEFFLLRRNTSQKKTSCGGEVKQETKKVNHLNTTYRRCTVEKQGLVIELSPLYPPNFGGCDNSVNTAVKNTVKSKEPIAAAREEPQPKVKSTAAKKEKSKRKFGLPAWVKDDRTRKIFGIFLVFFALFLFFSGASYVFTGNHDLRLIQPGPDAVEGDLQETYKNPLGLIGAHAGYFLLHRGFGLGALFIPFLLFIYGVRIWLRKRLLPLGKSTRLGLLGMLFIPLLIGFVFHRRAADESILLTCNDNLVGFGGQFLLNWFIFNLGGIGTFLVIVFISGATAVMNFNIDFEKMRLPKWLTSLFKKREAASAHAGQVDDDAPNEVDQPIHEPVLTNRIADEQNTKRADDILAELLGEEEPPFDVPFDNEEESESAEEIEFDDDIRPQGEKEKTEESSELEIEISSEETALSEDEIDDRLQEFGAYDPKLDLSRYELPNIDLLEMHGSGAVEINKDELEANKNRIVDTLNNYNIDISKIKATVGPTVTLYEIIPAPGVRISKIKNLEDDIALSLSALGIRIIAPIPGKGTIGIEVPNSSPNVVAMRSLIASDKFQNTDMELPIAIGKTISNETFTFDLAKMPHLLMAGATGQGKSVGLNAILVSLLYKKHPAQLKFVLVDPKKVELTLFNKIERHFLAKLPGEEEAIITDTSKVVTTLNSLCVEMDQRYELLKVAHCRNIKEYNKKFISRRLNPELGHRYLPYIVLVVDEFADLIMTAGKEVETPIARLAQLARAIGIHLIIATQRPSVNIITGTIKANFPARIAFRVTSKIDSRTILDAGGADQLIGRGDMLFSTGNDLIRIQCGFVDTPEVEQITEYIGSQQAYPQAYLLPEYHDESAGEIGNFDAADRDELFEEAARMIVMHQQGSTSLLQRKLKLGYNRAGRLIDQLEAAGIIGPFEGSKARKVLISDEASLEQFLHGRDH